MVLFQIYAPKTRLGLLSVFGIIMITLAKKLC